MFTTIAAALLAVAAVVYVLRESPGRMYHDFRFEDSQIHKARHLIRERIDAGEYPPSLDGIVGLHDDYGSEIEITVSNQGIGLRSPGRDKVLRTIDDWETFVRRYPVR